MSEADGVDIPVVIDVDAAKRNLQDLQSAAEALDARLEKLQNSAVQAFNRLNMTMGGQPYRAADYSGVEQFAQAVGPEQIWSMSPRLAQTMAEVEAQRSMIASRVGGFGAANPMTVAATGGQPLYSAFAGWAPPTPGQQPTTPFGGGSTPQDTDRTATMFGERFAQALTRAGANALTGATGSALGGVGLGAAGDIASGLVSSLSGAVLAPLAVGAAAIGLGLAANQKTTQYHQEEYGLAGAVGDTTGMGPANRLIGVQQTGWQFMYSEKDATAAAEQLGSVYGVQEQDMNGALANSMALARLSGGTISLGDATSLTGQLKQGGFSNAQIGQAYDEMQKQASLTGVSLDRLVTSLQALERTAGVSALNVNGMAAVQALAGSSINVGQALGPAVGATGTQALQQAAILGLSPQAFTKAQGSMPQLWDAYARLAKQYNIGPMGPQVAEEMLQSAGFDMSNLSGPAAEKLVDKLTTQGPQAAESYYTSLQKKEGKETTANPTKAMDDIIAKGKQAADQTTTAMQQAAIQAERIEAAMLLAADAINTTTPLSEAQKTAKHRMDTYNQQVAATTPMGTDVSRLRLRTDASGSPEFSPLSRLPVEDAELQGTHIDGAFMRSSTFVNLEQAAQRTGVPLAVLLQQAKVEATNSKTGMVDPSIISKDGGYGLGQFTDQGAAVKYLGMAAKQLDAGTVTSSNWHQFALNPQVAALAMGLYDADLYKRTGGDWQVALAQYNGGPHPNAAANQYGFDVYQGAQKVEVQFGGSIEITQNGKPVGTLKPGQNVTTKVSTTRKPVAHQTYGPGGRHHTPPTPPRR